MSQVFGDPKRLVNDYMAGSHAIGIRGSSRSLALPINDLGLIGLMKDVQAMEERVAAAGAALQDAQRQEQLRVDAEGRIRADLADLTINVQENSSPDTNDRVCASPERERH